MTDVRDFGGKLGLVDEGVTWEADCSLWGKEGVENLGFSLGLVGITGVDGVEGIATGVSCNTLKSFSLSGLGAGEIGRDGGLLPKATGTKVDFGAGVSLPRFSKRARIDETGLCDKS